MYKRFGVAICLFALVTVGCSKSAPEENPSAKLQGPSAAQMQNTYATTAKVRGGGAMGSPGMAQMQGGYGRPAGMGGAPSGMVGGGR